MIHPPIQDWGARSRFESLKSAILHRSAHVGVVGLSHFGLQLAIENGKLGLPVIGFDADPERVMSVNEGRSFVGDVRDADLATVVAAGRFRATEDFSELGTCDVIVVCIPMPISPSRVPDLAPLKAVTERIAATLRPGQLVCLESSVYPGATEEIVLPLLAATGLEIGTDIFLAYAPERADPGNNRYTTRNTNRVVGGVTPACLEVAALFYQQTIVDVVPVASPRIAEMTKVFESTFRSVNIALVNELTLLCDKMDINVWDVVEASATKPFGIMRFTPGPGVGGYCVPVDPFHLAWKAKQFDFNTRFIELAGEINRAMPEFVRDKICRALNERGQSVRDAHILMIGVSYKRDIGDPIESPTIKLAAMLEAQGAQISFHDPHVADFIDASGKRRTGVALTAEAIAGADCIVAMMDHKAVDWTTVVARAQLLVDTRNVSAPFGRRPNVVLL